MTAVAISVLASVVPCVPVKDNIVSFPGIKRGIVEEMKTMHPAATNISYFVGTGNPCKSLQPHWLHQFPKMENKRNSELTHIPATPFLQSILSLALSSKGRT